MLKLPHTLSYIIGVVIYFRTHTAYVLRAEAPDGRGAGVARDVSGHSGKEKVFTAKTTELDSSTSCGVMATLSYNIPVPEFQM